MIREDDDSRFVFLKKELEASLERNHLLEKENEELKHEVARLKGQISFFRAQNSERKSMLWKKLQNSTDSNIAEAFPQKPTIQIKIPEETLTVENACSRPDFPESMVRKERPARVPKPPPRATSATSPSLQEVNGKKVPLAPTPPVPPPLPSKFLIGSKAVRRVPELMELYRLLTRKDAGVDNRTNLPGLPVAANAQNMIGEIENRSSHLSAIKSDVETHGEFIRFLTKEVENAAYTDISDVEAFVKWLDEELSYLVDERAVLKHFPQWPERKADAMREAAFSYRDLKNLDSEVSSFQDNPKQAAAQALKRMQVLQDRLERSVHNMERMREGASKKYRDFQIPWKWMLDTGVIGQLKMGSLRLAKEYMKRIANELQTNKCPQEDDLMLQGVRFAYRVHQFAGGFDAETMHAFEELRKFSGDCHKQQQTVNKPHPYQKTNE